MIKDRFNTSLEKAGSYPEPAPADTRGGKDQPSSNRVLFVDDDPSVRQSLQQDLAGAGFEILTGESGAEGLRLLAEKAVDIVFSDLAMPEMDGLQFLKLVKDKFPTVKRGILCEYTEEPTVMKALIKGLANFYFPKPWDPTALRERIEHIFQLRCLLNNQKVLDVVNAIDTLPALPTVYHDFLQALNEDQPLGVLAEIINRDVAITTKVLQIANSAFFGAARTLSVEYALAFLGVNAIKDMMLTISLASHLAWTGRQKKHLQNIFIHSSLVNRFIKELYPLLTGQRIPSHFTSVGLIHDIGKIILLHYFFDRFESVLKYQADTGEHSFYQSELALGFADGTHAEIGAYFLDYWNLPETLIEVALFHHSPKACPADYHNLVLVVQQVNDLVNRLWPISTESDFEEALSTVGNLPLDFVRDVFQQMQEEKKAPNMLF